MLLSSIVLPLYIYPNSNTPLTGNWSPLFQAISANPLTKFTVIVNPSSGPGSGTYPDPNFIAHVAQLNTYPTVTTLGYVHTSYGTRSVSAATADINTYNNWASYPAADIHVDGIFLDEAPSAATPAALATMQSLFAAVRATFPPIRNIVMTNPGVQVDPRFFAAADFIVVFENTYAAYSPAVMAATPLGYANKAVAIVHSFTGSDADQQQIVTTFDQAGYGGLVVTTSDGYNEFSAKWAAFCADV